MRMYQSRCIDQDSHESFSSDEYLEQCRTEYVGRLFTLMVERGSALVRVASITDSLSMRLVRCNRASAAAAVIVPLTAFLAALECGSLVACSGGEREV
jgi:hypothetical protein